MGSIQLGNVTKVYSSSKDQVEALVDLNLEIQAGELLAVLGPSASGKTTLLRVIAGLEQVTSGTIRMENKVVNNVPAKDRNVAMVFQQYALYPHMSAYENMAFGLKIRNHTKEEIAKRVMETARILGIEDCLERKPETLSGGQRQRVALGRAIVRQPAICLLDEPLSNLDMESRIQVRGEIARLHKQFRMTMVYVTHDQSEALALGDRIAVIRQGAIQQVGRPMEIYDRPRNAFVAGFIGSPRMNFFSGSIERKKHQIVFQAAGQAQASSSDLVLALPESATEWVGRKVIMGIRPEHIRCAPKDAADSLAIEAQVELSERLGAYSDLRLRSSGHSFRIRVPGSCEAKPGEPVFCYFQLEHMHFFDEATEERIR